LDENDIDFHFREKYTPVMLVCHCKGVSERDLRCAIEAGARTQRELVRECGAGSVCGGCRPLIDELLDAHAPAPAALRLAHGLGLAAAS
jgi:bacterioferritin-associated ferredoxin